MPIPKKHKLAPCTPWLSYREYATLRFLSIGQMEANPIEIGEMLSKSEHPTRAQTRTVRGCMVIGNKILRNLWPKGFVTPTITNDGWRITSLGRAALDRNHQRAAP